MDGGSFAIVRSIRRSVSMGPGLRRDDGEGRVQPCVYIMASHRHGTLYIGVTSDLIRRVDQHRRGVLPGFTRDYRITRLVWREFHENMESAIHREKRLKEWRRVWKIVLIEANNPQWLDLAIDLGLPRLD